MATLKIFLCYQVRVKPVVLKSSVSDLIISDHNKQYKVKKVHLSPPTILKGIMPWWWYDHLPPSGSIWIFPLSDCWLSVLSKRVHLIRQKIIFTSSSLIKFNLIHCNGTLKELHGNKWNAEGFLPSWCKCCSYFFTSSNFCFSFVFGYGIIC